MRPAVSHPSRGRLAARRLAGVGALCAVVTAAAVGIAGCGGGGDAAGTYTVRAIFESASFVTSGLQVKTAGVKIGDVTDVSLTPDNRAAVTLKITDPGFQDFRTDATCKIRPQALIGERYIECQLTQPAPDGATQPPALPTFKRGPYEGEHLLPVSQTSLSIDSDEVLATQNASVRQRFAVIIRELGVGVAGRGDLIAAALAKSNDAQISANAVLRQLSSHTEMLKELTSNADQTLSSLAVERSSITGAIENSATVTSTLAKNKAQLSASITNLDALLKELPQYADRTQVLLDQLAPIASDLNRSADDTATILNLLPAFGSSGTTAVKSLGPTAQNGTRVLTSPTTNELIKRLVATSAGVKATGTVLGQTLGSLRSTGGLDYFLDAIYGLAYATNGRDANGTLLRGGLLNNLNCSLPSSVTSDTGCGIPLRNDTATEQPKTTAKKSATTPPASTTSAASTESAAAQLLFGGGR